MPASPFTTDIEFRDSDLFTESAKEWQADFVQLDQGPLTARIRQIGMQGTQVGEASLNRRLHQAGMSPPGGRTFVLQKVPFANFEWRGWRPGPNHLLCFPYNADFESISPPGFQIYGLSVPWRMLEQTAEALEYRINASLHLGLECVELPPAEIARIRQWMQSLLRWLPPLAEGIPGAAAGYQMELREVITGVIDLWLKTAGREPSPISHGKGAVISKALDHILEHEREALAVRDLCAATGASERTLQYAFRERFQLSPKQYLLARRLEGVRRDLRGPTEGRIGDIARSWGFNQLGRFAQQYRTVFDELPSETRNRRKS